MDSQSVRPSLEPGVLAQKKVLASYNYGVTGRGRR
jgi:hypothetical protein